MSLGCIWYKTRPRSSFSAIQTKQFSKAKEEEGGERASSEPVPSWGTEVSGWELGPQVLGGKDSAEQGLLSFCDWEAGREGDPAAASQMGQHSSYSPSSIDATLAVTEVEFSRAEAQTKQVILLRVSCCFQSGKKAIFC